jgi:PAS domain S-box-containing protein
MTSSRWIRSSQAGAEASQLVSLGEFMPAQMQSLNALFLHATEGIIISDSSGKILRANPAAERLFGYETDELEGCVIEDLVPRRYEKSHARHRHEYYGDPHPRSMGRNIDLFARRKDQTEFPVEISLSYYREKDELNVIAFIIDITERKRHEQSIVRLNQELERKVQERTKGLQDALAELGRSKQQLSEALEAQKELNDLKSRFVTMASHEFRTPLSAILSSTSLIGKYNALHDERIEKHVQRVRSAVTNMTIILDDFLSVEKLETGAVKIRKEHVEVPVLAKEIINQLQGLLTGGQRILHVHTGEAHAKLDPQIVRNILINLLSNAVKFSTDGSDVNLSTAVSAEITSIIVADRGIGIPPEEHGRLFGRFFRARNATNIQGTGLGLNIVSRYLEALGGNIRFESEPGKGTTFYVNIPND